MDVRELLTVSDIEMLEDGGYMKRLDWAYVGEVAESVASALRRGRPVEVAYQPGDGTFYGLVFTPLGISPVLESAPPRVVERDGARVVWEEHACRGVGQDLDYGEGYVLLSWVEHSCYPFPLDRGTRTATTYVSEKLGVKGASAVALALLLRAVSEHSPSLRVPVRT